MFRDAYAAELDYLYQTAAELAQGHPRIAPMLGRDADPGVTRVFQHAAFLFARLGQRMDDDLPEVIHPVIESAFPALLRPLPCSTIMELRLDDTVKEPVVAARGSLFASGDSDSAQCIFAGMDDVPVRPWALERVDLASEGRELRLRVALLPGAKLSSLDEASTLRLFLGGAGALDLRGLLLRRTKEALVRSTARAANVVDLGDGGERPIRPVAAPRAHPSDAGPAALHTLRSYFAWPAHFAFLDVPNIARVLPIAMAEGAFEIVLRLAESLPRGVQLGPQDVRLHCVPAVNIHPLLPMTLPLEGKRCALTLPRPEMHVYAVRSVSVLREDLTSRESLPYSDFSLPSAAPDDEPPILFSADRLPSTVGPDPIVSLSLETDADLAPFVNTEVHLDVTDGVSPEGIGLGDLRQSVSGSPPGVTFRNVAPVTRAAAPAFDADRLWRWLQFLKASLPQLTSVPHLAACVALANHPAWAEWPDAKPGAQLFEGILAVRLAPSSGRDDTVVPIVLDVDLAAFTGTGDLDLFGECMAAVFASTVRPYDSIALTLRDGREQPLLRYGSVPGTKEGL